MNVFFSRAIDIIKAQTGAEIIECKKVFDKTHSIQDSIRCIRMSQVKGIVK